MYFPVFYGREGTKKAIVGHSLNRYPVDWIGLVMVFARSFGNDNDLRKSTNCAHGIQVKCNREFCKSILDSS